MAQLNESLQIPCKEEVEFSVAFRWQHWIRALSVVVLVVSGFYLAYPFLSPPVNSEPTGFLYALFRSWHEIFGFILVTVILYKTFLFFFSKQHANERVSFKDFLNPSIWISQIKYYLLIEKHPAIKGAYNPLQFIAYVGFYIMIFLLILTGLILYSNVYHSGFGGLIYAPMKFFETLFGGLSTVRLFHHILTWGIILFVTVHVYMAIYNSVFGKEGGMDAIFSGRKWKKNH
jgi:Ni/Fe-hydrogenase 1 B-type cytochrome subunit